VILTLLDSFFGNGGEAKVGASFAQPFPVFLQMNKGVRVTFLNNGDVSLDVVGALVLLRRSF
jgi:hypothetical protein